MSDAGDEAQLFEVAGLRADAGCRWRTTGGTVHDILAAAPAGVYSGMRTFGGNRFLRLDAHLDRVEANLAALGWEVGFDRAGFRRALHRAVTDYPLADARVRFDVLSEAARELGARSNVLLALSPFEPVPERFVREGVAVELTGELHRDQPLIKTTEFVEHRKPYPVGDIACYEHVMLDEDERLLECTSANFFGVREGVLVTAGAGVLEGITRSIFLELARGRRDPRPPRSRDRGRARRSGRGLPDQLHPRARPDRSHRGHRRGNGAPRADVARAAGRLPGARRARGAPRGLAHRAEGRP